MARRIDSATVLLNEVRVRMFALLARPQSINDLARLTGVTTSSIRWHLVKMERAGLVCPIDEAGRTYRRTEGKPPTTALAAAALDSIPARELVRHVLAHPGQHLGQAASALGAPRSRYWRILPRLVEAGVLKVALDGRRRRLSATPLAKEALLLTADGLSRARRRSRRRARSTLAAARARVPP